jgi:lauroyl/myristoyl acyltransferase
MRSLSAEPTAPETISLRAHCHRMLAGMLVHTANFHRRMLGVAFALLGPDVAYALTTYLARRLYRLLDPLRTRSEAQCRAAIGGLVGLGAVPVLAERAFVHRVWNLTDLLLADRFLQRGTFPRFGGVIPGAFRERLLSAQRRGQPAILLTAYYGPYDLLPVLLGFNGVKASVAYLPHANRAFDVFRRRVRARGGCEMVPVPRAAGHLGAVLARGGTIALVADHHVERRGIPATFLGLPTRADRSVGLLAKQYSADIVVAGVRRVGERFRSEVVVADVIDHTEWAGHEDIVGYITHRYLRGLESIILGDPTQYLWAYPRWGEATARRLTGEPQSSPA